MNAAATGEPPVQKVTERIAHARAVRTLNRAGVPYTVAGAFAFGFYTGIWRQTKDLDLFCAPVDVPAALRALRAAGYATEMTAPHWLAKAVWHEWVVDVIFGFGGWRALIDDHWLERSRPTTVYGVPSQVIPSEELIWVKTFVGHRERFDGADVAHLLLATGRDLDWPHLLWRFGPDWELLLAELCLFRFIYPGAADRVPAAVWDDLFGRLAAQARAPAEADPICQGPLLDRFSYLTAVETWGYWDARARWALRNGFPPSAVAADRREAMQTLTCGRVEPAEVA